MSDIKLGISADKSGGSHSNVKQCKDCGLYSNCQGPVPSVGPLDARLVIVGESPGTEEDQKGEPFVGDTGKLLTFMLKEAGLVRSQCRITNAIKCFPNKQKLTVKHAEYCKPVLMRELLKLKQIECIVAFGNFAASSLIGRSSISEINGYWWEWNEIPVLTLLHPSFVLRNLSYLNIQIRHLRKAYEFLNVRN